MRGRILLLYRIGSWALAYKSTNLSAAGYAVLTTFTDYGTWFVAAVTVTNIGTAPVAGWTMVMETASPVTSLWAGQIVQQSANDYIVTNAAWNAAIPVGGAQTFYYTGNGTAPPVTPGYIVNGVTLGTSSSALSHAAAPQAGMTVTQNWGTGWNGLVTITTGGATTTNGWTVSFDLASSIVGIWDGAVVSHVGTHYVVQNVAWDATLAAGKPVTFGFNAQGALPGLPTNIVVTPGPITVAAPPTLNLAGTTVTELPGGVNAIFTVTLSAAGATPVSFNYTTLDGSALAGTDYQAISGTATIAPGQTSLSLAVATRPGRTGSESFSLMLSGLVGAQLAGGTTLSASGTIINAPSLSVSGATVAETSSGASNAMFAISLSGIDAVPVTVAYTTMAGSAVAGVDFTQTSGTVTIAPGQTTASVAVPTFNHPSGTRSFSLVLSNPTNAGIATGSATATLISTAAPIIPPSSTPPALLLGNVTQDLTPPSAGAVGTMLPGGYLHTSGNQIVDTAGTPVRINAVGWFGFENTHMVPDGLGAQSYRAIMDRMVQAGFNALRLPFSNALLHNPIMPSGINLALNPDLAGLSGLALMDKIIAYAGQIGLKVILDDHNSSGTNGLNASGLWYDQTYSDANFQSDWAMLAKHYAGNATVIGADLFNEPHSVISNGSVTGATWGDGSATDWQAAAQRAGNAIQAVNPNWLIVVEGIQAYQNDYTNWGANLEGVASHPVVLNVANQLVYSAHTYPSTVDTETWNSVYNKVPDVTVAWTKQFGYIAQQNMAPLFIGEYGANYTSATDLSWMKALTAYANTQAGVALQPGQQGLSTAYWAWNAYPGTTLVGLTQPDYATANTLTQSNAQSLAYHAASQPNQIDFSVALAAPQTAPVSIVYTTQDGTGTQAARAGVDYVATSGTLTFAPGETAKIVPALLLNPSTSKGAVSFVLNLSTMTGQVLGSETATIIHDLSATVSRTSQQWANVAFNTVTITNTSQQTINGWEVAVQSASQVMPSEVYDGQLVSQSGTLALFTSAAWNQTIAPGASAHFEFGATQTVINTPVTVSIVHTGY